MVKRVFGGILNFILPSTCVCCEKIMDNGEQFVCPNCFSKLERFDETHPWKTEYIKYGIIDNSLSAFWFREGTEIQTIIHALKYEKMKSTGKVLGREIAKRIIDNDGEKFDYIVPVPLHRAKLRERTYNQSEYVASGISRLLGIEVLNKCLKRTRFTKTQTKLSKYERMENVRGAFIINKKLKPVIENKNILLTDDVITTGATILECARVLKESLAGKVWVCSAAYAALD